MSGTLLDAYCVPPKTSLDDVRSNWTSIRLMPTYTYRREDGTTFETKQKITEDPLEECPETGQDVERIITGSAGVIFKGEGFHVNDYDDHGPADDE